MSKNRIHGFLYILLLYTQSLYAITPPPSSIRDSNLGREVVGEIEETKWVKDTNVEVAGTIRLTADREVRGIWMHDENKPLLNLNGKMLTVGKNGINAYSYGPGLSINSGSITSSEAALSIKADVYPSEERSIYVDRVYHNFHINANIQDHRSHKVGLVFSGPHQGMGRGMLRLGGKEDNTFTGDVVVEGRYNALFLDKQNGATAIQSKAIYVKAQGRLAIASSDQIIDSATVTLTGNGSMLSFTGVSGPNITRATREKIHELVVESGTGIFNFMHSNKFRDLAKKTILLDDLVINGKASLRIVGWEAGRDFFLVRKDSQHLADAMKKISIDGWQKNQIYLRDYDRDYWSIEAAPEPVICGAVLSAVGVLLGRYRRARRGGCAQ